MVKRKSFWGMLALALAFAFVSVGCASLTWNTPVRETGTRGGLETALANANAREVARYTTVFGFLNFGMATFDGLTVAAARAGDDVHILVTRGLFWRSTRSFATSN